MYKRDSKLIENQIRQLVEEMESEISGNIAYVDVEVMKEIVSEIDELQHQLWKIESGECLC